MNPGTGMTLAVYQVGPDGTRVVKPPMRCAVSEPTAWPWGIGSMPPDPPCECSPGCSRYPPPAQ